MVIEVAGADGSPVFIPAQFVESMVAVEGRGYGEYGVEIRTISGAGYPVKFDEADEARAFIEKWLRANGVKADLGSTWVEAGGN